MGDTEEAILRSLRLKTDTRYETMQRYRDEGGMHSSSSHFQRMLKRSRRMNGLPETETVLKKDSSHAAMAQWNREFEESDVAMTKEVHEPTATIQDRINWQHGFDHSVRRLLQDFDLSDSPGCRLNHLERMHHWFQQHGAKTARKAERGPNFLTMDRNSSPAPGSAMHRPSPSSPSAF